MLESCKGKGKDPNEGEIKRYYNNFIQRTEWIEERMGEYNYLEIEQKIEIWLKISNLFAAFRSMSIEWGLRDLGRGFIKGCIEITQKIEDNLNDIQQITKLIERGQKKWNLNHKFSRIIEDRECRERAKARRVMEETRRNEIRPSQAGTLRQFLDTSVKGEGRGTDREWEGTQGEEETD